MIHQHHVRAKRVAPCALGKAAARRFARGARAHEGIGRDLGEERGRKLDAHPGQLVQRSGRGPLGPRPKRLHRLLRNALGGEERALIQERLRAFSAEVILPSLQRHRPERRSDRAARERNVAADELFLECLRAGAHDHRSGSADAAKERGEKIGERLSDSGRRLDDEGASLSHRLGPEPGHLALAGTILPPALAEPQAVQGGIQQVVGISVGSGHGSRFQATGLGGISQRGEAVRRGGRRV